MSAARAARQTSTGWQRALPGHRQVLWGLLIAFVGSAILVGIGYATTSIPNPNSFSIAQATTLYYSDGKHVIGRIGETTRIDVHLSDVPVAVQHAVLAAEDRRFYSEPGISPTGIVRALITDLRGGEIAQGGSTITQQYVKNAYLTQARTFTRKFREIFIAVKLAQSEPKRQILQDYLNTIYFGRGAYGIQAAAQAYFGTDVQNLDAAQGAVLAATISQPSLYDPYVDKSAAVARWHYVIDGMAAENWLPPGEAQNMKYPDVVKPSPATKCGQAWKAFICAAVQLELAKDGFDKDRLAAGGYNVVTTIDRTDQLAAVKAIRDQGGRYVGSGVDKGREASLVSVQPGDGAIRAMYGGDDYCQHQHPDDCTDLSGVTGRMGGADYARPPGSSFKPYTLITALKQGIGLDSVYPGPSQIDVNGATIHNSEGETCGACTLLQATAESINTIFVPLAVKVGPQAVVDNAYTAGIPKSRKLPAVPVIGIGGGVDVSPLDQAEGFATIAAQGTQADPYLVDKVETQKGSVVFQAHPKTTDHVFPSNVMADTTYALTKVLDCSYNGTACGKALSGRPAAGKTGTQGATVGSGNVDAWFVGFTPQLCTAVWYGNHDRNHLVTSNGLPLYGGDLPAATWQEMMNAALAGKPVLQFPPPAHVGTSQGIQTTPPSAPTTSSSPAPTKTTGTGSPQPSITVSPTLTTASPSPSPTQTSSTPKPTGKPT